MASLWNRIIASAWAQDPIMVIGEKWDCRLE
jgi:hypothetical protein